MVIKIANFETLVERQSCLKVLPTASIFKPRFVKNFAAMINSEDRSWFFNEKLEASLSWRERNFPRFLLNPPLITIDKKKETISQKVLEKETH